MKTILVDGNWNLKRNFHKRRDMKTSTGYLCGGSFGFLDSMRSVMNRILPDRVVVAWDGFQSGKLRYEIYPPYKSKRKEYWMESEKAIATDGLNSSSDLEKVEFLKQKIQTQNYLEEMCIRQLESDYIEADDFIAQYILTSSPNEEIYIYSRDRDYLQLISDRVSIINPDSQTILNRREYEEKNKHTLYNELLFKCFEGDTSDEIGGVNGITRDTLIKYFPRIATEKYTYSKLIEECFEAQKDKKIGKRKVYNKIIESESVLYRNAKLMNLKKPFLNQEAIDQVDVIQKALMDNSRSVETAISLFIKDGMINNIQDNSLENFFSPFYRIMTKEREYSQKMKI